MGSAPHHPFLDRVLDHLHRYAHWWVLPYLTVMLSTGPLFLSAMWKEYIWSHPKRGQEISVLMPNWYVNELTTDNDEGLMKTINASFRHLEALPGIVATLHLYFGYKSPIDN